MVRFVDPELHKAMAINKKGLERYPGSASFTYLGAKIMQVDRKTEQSIAAFEVFAKATFDYPQIPHVALWELSWNYAYLFEWEKAAACVARLLDESQWSKCFFAYMQASFLLMTGKLEHAETIEKLFKSVPRTRQKFLGYTIPVEDFAVDKAQFYFKHKNTLFLPALELLYLLGYIRPFPEQGVGKVIEFLDTALADVRGREKYKTAADDASLCLLLKGCLQRESGEKGAAETSLNEVCASEKAVNFNHYLAPFARMELAKLYVDEQRLDEAQEMISDSRGSSFFSSMKLVLEFRLHLLGIELGHLRKPSKEREHEDQTKGKGKEKPG